ncbi:hypothetical protein [Nocardia otitidiscaviarum]|uniref:hypothetical protein n=1 Tax=Nocardia otitidiscaviarum TaxID=1823 RepID=UPI0004A6ECC0|nr:hypothetical protein [Nocardia otitidiscaviarum]
MATTRLDKGAWLAYPVAGERAGEGGDAYETRYFGNSEESELKALRYANDHEGFRAVYMAEGESVLEAEGHRE